MLTAATSVSKQEVISLILGDQIILINPNISNCILLDELSENISNMKKVMDVCPEVFPTILGNYMDGLPNLEETGWNFRKLGTDKLKCERMIFFNLLENQFTKDKSASFGLVTTEDVNISQMSTGLRLPSLIGYALPLKERTTKMLLDFELFSPYTNGVLRGPIEKVKFALLIFVFSFFSLIGGYETFSKF